jgi:formylglycine-generating enzyme required for sulfatase activity
VTRSRTIAVHSSEFWRTRRERDYEGSVRRLVTPPFALALSAVTIAIAVLGACTKSNDAANDAGRAPEEAAALQAAPADAAIASSGDAESADANTANGPCPSDMIHVDTMFCPKIKRNCLDVEHEHPNNLTICHKFEEGVQSCEVEEEHRDFCIDQYEYPNKDGAHPVWMLTWYEAQATCESKGKRLCWASEWTAACEGPEHTPFPYGWVRDHDTCNIDNFYVEVRKGPGGVFLQYSKDPAVRDPELARLDQSVPSGLLANCKSGFDVHDQTGNFDEWVISDRPAGDERSKWAGLMGGAWGHVRNQCRPMTTSHYPQENYYFWSFRCCKDAEGAPSWTPPPCKGEWGCPAKAPPVEPHDFAPDPIVVVNPAGPSKTKYGRSDRNVPPPKK